MAPTWQHSSVILSLVSLLPCTPKHTLQLIRFSSVAAHASRRTQKLFPPPSRVPRLCRLSRLRAQRTSDNMSQYSGHPEATKDTPADTRTGHPVSSPRVDTTPSPLVLEKSSGPESELDDAAEKGVTAASLAVGLPGVPDGGTRAWLTVFGAHLFLFHTFGWTNAWGVLQVRRSLGSLGAFEPTRWYLQSYYAQHKYTDYSSSSIAWM